jgi:apoptosis-inducing factor 3
MTEDTDQGPDLSRGIPISAVPPGAMLHGHVGDSAVLLVRRGEEFFAIDATCTHYHGPLAKGYFDGETVRCPWHHACFSVRTGEAVRAPAFDPVATWGTELRDGKAFVTGKRSSAPARKQAAALPARIVIVGGGAAGFAAAEMLRREQYQGSIVMLSADGAAPVDRPNPSKDFLAGSAREEWVPLRPPSWYHDQKIELRLNSPVQ